jgi:hypothetical protein
MTGMRYRRQTMICAGLCLTILGFSRAADLRAQAPATGEIAFQARIQPAGGRPEPVRGLPFFLLRKSLAEVRKEAEQSEPATDLQGFIEGLSVSAELKSWMREHHTVALAGTEFTKQLTADDVTGIPEFLEAYMRHNGASLNAGVPSPKFKESDRLSNPEKYNREREQYLQTIKRHIAARPETMEGIDASLGDSNPTQRWTQRQAEQQRKIERRSLALAQTTYLAAQTNSDLEGRGLIRGLVPGTYWLATLDTPAMAGDVRLHWDVAVQVAPGETARIELGNVNAVEPASRPLL